jgi:hypothetical protein
MSDTNPGRHPWLTRKLSDEKIRGIGREYVHPEALVKVGPAVWDRKKVADLPLSEAELAALPADFDRYRVVEFPLNERGPVDRKQRLGRNEFRLREYLRSKGLVLKPYRGPDERPIRRAGNPPDGPTEETT